MATFKRVMLASAGVAAVAMMGAAAAGAAEGDSIVALMVRTPHAGFNRMVVSVTVCVPGTANCATIDDIMVDTGSTGLRLEASAVPAGLTLPAFTGAGAKPLAECLRFVHDDAWGALYRADVRIGGLMAQSLPIQVIADDLGPRPGGCPVSSAKPTSNGTLGIGPHLLDCQGACAQEVGRPGVFGLVEGVWVAVGDPVPVGSRLPNPVSVFPEHSNGVILDLPASPEGGTRELVGTLTFGVNTAANNRMAGSWVLRFDARGQFTTRYNGANFPDSYIDSGTETYILADDGLPKCLEMLWAYCVAPSRTMSATLIGSDGHHAEVAFMIGDYRAGLDRRVGAWDGFAEVAENSSRAFVWGAPFFIGRRVSLVFDGRVTGDGDVAVPGYYVLP